MRICYLDAFSGVSGDMLVGALADAGADSSAITDALRSLATEAVVSFEKVKRCGIAATKFHVRVDEPVKHRHLSGILKMIEDAALPDQVKQNASAVFRRLGEAEAAAIELFPGVHGDAWSSGLVANHEPRPALVRHGQQEAPDASLAVK